MHRGVRRFVGVVAFFAIGFAIYGLVSAVLTPLQRTSVMSDKYASFQSEPKNTVEVLFLGPSTTEDAYIPAQLYEEYGICSYNLGTSAQPMLASLALASEAYWAHPRTLRTIVLDCSTLFYESSDAFYRLALDEVSLPSKLGPVLSWEGSGDDKMVYLNDVYAYHNRWSELDEEDWEKLGYPSHGFLRGYEPLWNRVLTEGDTSVLSVPLRQPDPAVAPSQCNPNQLRYFEELARFCEDRDITLVLSKSPLYDNWSDDNHWAVARLASEHGIDFLDLNYEPFFSSTGYNQALDTRDGYHPNDSGAQKITGYVGNYLVRKGLASDVRGDPDYAFMEGQLASYHALTSDLFELRANVDPVDYLAGAMANPDYTVFLGIDGEGTSLLTADQRRRLEALGLDWLADARPGESYRAVIADGKVVDEDLATRADTRLLSCYIPEMYVEPKRAYFKMFKSSDEESMAALQRAENPDEIGKGEWYFIDPGLTVIVYDDANDSIADWALFRAVAGLKRYCDPQALLDQYLAEGADQLPWYLWRLMCYEDLCRQAPPGTGIDDDYQPVGATEAVVDGAEPEAEG